MRLDLTLCDVLQTTEHFRPMQTPRRRKLPLELWKPVVYVFSTSSTSPFRLLDLPVEVRLRIYGYYTDYTDFPVTKTSCHVLPGVRVDGPVAQLLSLSQVCRQVRFELLAECFRQKAICLDVFDTINFCRCFAKPALDLITVVELGGIWLQLRWQHQIFLQRRYLPMFDALQSGCSSLRSLKLIWCGSYSNSREEYKNDGAFDTLVPLASVFRFPRLAELVMQEAGSVQVAKMDVSTLHFTRGGMEYTTTPSRYRPGFQPYTSIMHEALVMAFRNTGHLELRVIE